MSEQFEATKELTIDGKTFKAGALLPHTIDPERVRRGLHASPPSVRVRRQPAPTAPAPAKPAAAAPAPKPADKADDKPAKK